jgi:Flp pilus assembly pilin Flp
MKTLLAMARDLRKDQSGASFIEYTVLLGVVLAIGVAVVQAMGTSASAVWNNMVTALNDIADGP